MGFFGGSKKKTPTPPVPPGQVIKPQWATRPSGKFHRFVELDPEELGLSGQGGIYVIWHGGVRPAWVYVGSAPDLAQAMHELARNKDILHYDMHGGLFISWALLKEELWEGTQLFLKLKLKPVEDNPAIPDAPDPEAGIFSITVVPPGMHLQSPDEQPAE